MNQLSTLNAARVKKLLLAALAALPELPADDAAELRAATQAVNNAIFGGQVHAEVAVAGGLAVRDTGAQVARTRYPNHYVAMVAGGGQVLVRAHGWRPAFDLAKENGYAVIDMHSLGRVNYTRERAWAMDGGLVLIEEETA